MLDPNFDPYEELMICKHNTQEIARALNHISETMKEMANQHQSLTLIVRNLKQRIIRLEHEIRDQNSSENSSI